MQQHERIDRFIAEVQAARTYEQVLAALEMRTRSLGFEAMAYAFLSPPLSKPDLYFVLTTYPKRFVDRYRQQAYRHDDAVFRYAATAIQPFTWPEIERRKWFSARQRRIYNEGLEFGIRSLGVVPIHGPGSARATLSVVGSTNASEFDKQFNTCRHELILIALYAHERILQQAGLAEAEPADLSDREREILAWTARGKTRGEIASILGISDHSVKVYLVRAARKLNAVNKAHAASIALTQGLIRL